jgi:ParB-like chromosome segregation protein Spo0J
MTGSKIYQLTNSQLLTESMSEHIFEMANAAYESRRAEGHKPSIPEIEKEFGIAPKKLANWRSNRKRSTPESDYTSLDIALLRENPENSRTAMDAGRLDGLAKSIRRRGVRMPLEVRELPDGDNLSGPLYEVVTGNRRLRATNRVCADLLAEGEIDLMHRRRVVPVKILTEEEAGERKYLELIENLQREDVSPLDEAVAYRWLVDHHHDTPASLALQLGLDKSHISNRLRLPDAPKALLEALAGGLVSAKHCEIVARIPWEGDRDTAACRVLNPKMKTDPLTVDETLAMIRRDFMISLRPQAKPGFDLEDGTLVPEAGACGPCKSRAENAEDVRVAIYGTKQRGVDPMTCLNPGCARLKRLAALRRIAAMTESEVLSEDACAAVFGGLDGAVAYDADYVAVESLPDEISGAWEGPTYVGRNPTTGDVVTLVSKTAAEDLQRAMKGRKALDATVSETIWTRPDGEWAEDSPYLPYAELSREQQKQWEGEIYVARNLVSGEVHDLVAKVDFEKFLKKKKPSKSGEKLAVEAMERLMQAIFTQGITEADIDALTATELQETPAAMEMFRAWLKPKAKDDAEAILEMMDLIGAKGVGASTAYLALAILSYGLRERGVEDPAYRAFAERFGV